MDNTTKSDLSKIEEHLRRLVNTQVLKIAIQDQQVVDAMKKGKLSFIEHRIKHYFDMVKKDYIKDKNISMDKKYGLRRPINLPKKGK